ncbi:MAG TPA: hypothetical protein DDW54_02565, partial [Clostridiales bacterium]|nr:hypothetical protein [Clostridiales bacterium]
MTFKDVLVRSTNAYKIISGEKRNGALGHAYLIICPDGEYLADYLKILAKTITCENSDGYCDECRACRLIEKNAYADCTFYPSDGKKILTADVDDLIENSIIKPLESDKRLFVLSGAENMVAVAQNKILKTLEEPPNGVHILMGATTDAPLLPTIKSRVKKIDMPPFSDAALYNALKGQFPDGEKLKRAIALSGGKASKAADLYGGEKAEKTTALCRDILRNMKSSKDAAKYAGLIDKDNIAEFISAMKTEVGYMLKKDKTAVEAEGYGTGALIAI